MYFFLLWSSGVWLFACFLLHVNICLFSSANPHSWSHFVTTCGTSQAFITWSRAKALSLSLKPHDLSLSPSPHLHLCAEPLNCRAARLLLYAVSTCMPTPWKLQAPCNKNNTCTPDTTLHCLDFVLFLYYSPQQEDTLHGMGPSHKMAYWTHGNNMFRSSKANCFIVHTF